MYVPVLPPACYSLHSYRLTYRDEEKEQEQKLPELLHIYFKETQV